jgi:succinylarginine dihydrolase
VSAVEVNYDGLAGPTYALGKLGVGNLASQSHGGQASNPREAVLQGLAKMERLMALGVPQAVIPPQERPHLPTLRTFGFAGSDADTLESAAREAPALLGALSASSSVWTANAATVSPSADTADGKVHFTPANLASQLHRAVEAPQTARILKRLFPDPERFVHHAPLLASAQMGDEGAANFMRLTAEHGAPGTEVFVYGQAALEPDAPRPRRFPARQTLEASGAVARLHRVTAPVFLQQAPDAIDAGVFHNDVAAVANENVLLTYAAAFRDPAAVERALDPLRQRMPFWLFEVDERELPLAEAVRTYLFNSQLVTLPGGGSRMALVAPAHVAESPAAKAVADRLLAEDNPVAEFHALDVGQSMKNGGGPACLRLRVVLTAQERSAAHPGVFLDEGRLAQLRAWARTHYRDRLQPDDIRDPALLREMYEALDTLTEILDLPGLYDFQRG